MKNPLRLKLAQIICQHLPSFIAQKIRSLVYPHHLAIKDDYPFISQSITGSSLKTLLKICMPILFVSMATMSGEI